MRSALVVALLITCTACGIDGSSTVVSGDVDQIDDAASSLATDSADRSCNVVLRHIERAATTNCTSNGACWFVWNGTIDLALASKVTGSTVWVQYKNQDATTWSKKQATAVTGGPTGFQRYAVTLDTKTFSPGMSATSMERAKIELLPYLKLRDGSRTFDHNRVSSDFASYALVASNAWSIAEDAAVCRPAGATKGVVDFRGDFTQTQHGPLMAGGLGVINYDLNRLQACRGTHNGFPAFDITATVRFLPAGTTTLTQSVRAFDAPGGTPDVTTLHAVPFEFTIPLGTQRVEMWFDNTGIGCGPAYDSNSGNNYSFDVSTTGPAPIGFVGNGAASLSRQCEANIAIPEPIVLDEYIRERACSFVELDVWAAGLTDQAAMHPELIAARAEASLDGTALAPVWLTLVGKNGNNYRYRYTLPRDSLYYSAKWSTLSYTVEFSTDGVVWSKDQTRTAKRDPSWCNPSWGSCN